VTHSLTAYSELHGAPTFLTGDRVVLPPYGIGTVCGTCLRPVLGADVPYYELSFPHTSARAYVPVASPAGAGLRPALTEVDLKKLLDCLRTGEVELPRQWAARQRTVTEMLVSGDPFLLATLTSALRRWNMERGLPDLDRQAYQKAIKLLQQEIVGLEGKLAGQVSALLDAAQGEEGPGRVS
jgi:CarD family transcriptional regulator